LSTVFLSTLCVVAADVPLTKTPAPGQQVVQVMELPAMTGRRTQVDRDADRVKRDAEKARRDALTQEQRNAEDKERRRQSFETMRHPKPLSETETQTIFYHFFLPSDYDSKTGKRWPLLLFLHGAGERGDDIEKVKTHGPPKLLTDPEKAKDWPFITVSPQSPDGYPWTPQQLIKLLDELEKKYAVDESRVYITGLSMGGYGTWGTLYQFPKRFAAAVPIAAGFDPEVAETFLDIPIWAFHGAKDKVVTVDWGSDMVDAIKEKGGKKVKLTIYPDREHDSWTPAYNDPELYRWLLEQKREL